MLILLTIVLMLPVMTPGQAAKGQATFDPLKSLIGRWEGTGKGQPGNSTVEREYQFVLGAKFIQVRNKSVYPPQEKNPKGEVHEDWGMISYDRDKKQFVLRQFHIEGFVNHYRLDRASAEGTVFTFVSDGIENIPAGWRARETYKIFNENEFVETFELAPPGKEFATYSETHFKRKK